jgi:phage shock protein PspC (stress-responsive transcriptional regulator)
MRLSESKQKVNETCFMAARLRKSNSDRMISGVCGGIAEYLGWDPTIVRILFVVTTFLSGIPLFIYLILIFVMPD